MEKEPESIRRKIALVRELETRCTEEMRWARWNHRGSWFSMLLALGCTVMAGALGFFYQKADPKVIAGFAVLPPLIAFVAKNLKFEAKNSWHARLHDGLDSLRSRLVYQQPEVPALEQVARIASDRDALEIRMQAEWDRELLLNWTGVLNHPTRPQSSESSAGPDAD
jgi:hypothetical protein